MRYELIAGTMKKKKKATKLSKVVNPILSKKSSGEKLSEYKKAIDDGWASIEFLPDGTILSANMNFIATMGYKNEDEIAGKHHKIFCEDSLVISGTYSDFWKDLNKGLVRSGEFKRIRKDGEIVWINASYTPVKNKEGNVVKIIKIATNITEMVKARVQSEGVNTAVNTGWASIEFDPGGNILDVNHNFLKALGYSSKKEVVGKHHKMFCYDDFHQSESYSAFWKGLALGNIQSGEFKRRTKDGRTVWINASYTPVRDDNGYVVKIIKIAADVTEMVETRAQAGAIRSAVNAGWASIEFSPDGIILSANQNFITTLGYSDLSELEGKHHRMFCDDEYMKSSEYRQFWSDLANGKVFSGEFKRIRKNGDTVWINASYTPVKDESGVVYKVIKIASDITEQKDIINQVQHVINKVNIEGDLTVRVSSDTNEGDYKILSESINNLIDVVANPISETQELANLVATSSEEMTTKGDQMKKNTVEVSTAIQEMAEGVNEQAQQIDGVNKLVDDVLQASKNMAEKSKVIHQVAEDGQEKATEGVSTILKVVDNMKSIQQSASTTSESIQVLTQRSEDIARTLNVITDIASQTNLLALNAAIEAARAGEAGRGFAVVAEEIRKLAEDSRKSAQEIERVISEVQKDVYQASKSIEAMEQSVDGGNKASAAAEDVFNKINEYSHQTVNFSKEILVATETQEVAINDTVKNIEKIVVVSEETASGTEQVASASVELNQGMDEISATSKDLADVANQLLEGVAKFKVGNR